MANANGNGGARQRAGRPKGTKEDQRKIDALEMLKNVRNTVMPYIDPEIAKLNAVEIMMTASYVEAQAGRWMNAAQMAANAAPYLHPRLQQIQLNADVKSSTSMSSNQIEAILLQAAQGKITNE